MGVCFEQKVRTFAHVLREGLMQLQSTSEGALAHPFALPPPPPAHAA